MNKPIITTRGTNKASKIGAIGSGIVDVLFAVFMFNFFKNKITSYPEYLQFEILQDAVGPIIFATIGLGLLLIYTAYQFATCKSYVDIYEDRVEGKGIQNVYQIVDFKLDYTKITSITCMGISVYINTSGGKYRILTNVKTAKEIFDYYNTECLK